jgi:hypothetical protein
LIDQSWHVNHANFSCATLALADGVVRVLPMSLMSRPATKR